MRFSGEPRASVVLQSAPVATEPTGDPWLISAAAKATTPAPGMEALRASGDATLRLAKRPNRKAEAWRRFDFSLLFAAELEAPSSPVDPGVASTFITSEGGEDCRLARVVFVDGVFNAELSDLDELPRGAYAGSLSGFVPCHSQSGQACHRQRGRCSAHVASRLGAAIAWALHPRTPPQF